MVIIHYLDGDGRYLCNKACCISPEKWTHILANIECANCKREIVKKLAKFIHDTYEYKSKLEGWKTQDKCKVEFDKLPKSNKKVMLYVAKQVIDCFLLTDNNVILFEILKRHNRS